MMAPGEKLGKDGDEVGKGNGLSGGLEIAAVDVDGTRKDLKVV